jgi:hypothetical protein
MRVSACPRFFATTISGIPAMTARLAQVWRKIWKLIALGALASRPHRRHLLRRFPGRPLGAAKHQLAAAQSSAASRSKASHFSRR